MKKILLVLIALLCFGAVASAKEKTLDLVESEVATLKANLPMEDTVIKLYDITYTPKKGLSYFYILKTVGAKEREMVGTNLQTLKEEAFTILCSSLPVEFVDELLKTKTPIIYKYYDNSSKPIADIVYDLDKCPKN